jgi:hypothetical protein
VGEVAQKRVGSGVKYESLNVLHLDIADTLGWPVEDTYAFSLLSLRELVRPVNEDLAARITKFLALDSAIRR